MNDQVYEYKQELESSKLHSELLKEDAEEEVHEALSGGPSLNET